MSGSKGKKKRKKEKKVMSAVTAIGKASDKKIPETCLKKENVQQKNRIWHRQASEQSVKGLHGKGLQSLSSGTFRAHCSVLKKYASHFWKLHTKL